VHSPITFVDFSLVDLITPTLISIGVPVPRGTQCIRDV